MKIQGNALTGPHRLFRGLHDSHKPALLMVLLLLAVLALIQFLAWLIPATPGSTGVPYYLALHALMETVAIVIAMMVFGVGWNAHSARTPGNLAVLACFFFAIGCLDFSHTAAYGGMPDLGSPNGPDKHLNFWMAARILAASALLLVTLRSWEQGIRRRSKYALFCALLTAVLALNWAVIADQEAMPDWFIPGQGLTPLKKALEYLCIALNLITLVALWIKMRQPQRFNAPLLFAAAGVMAMSEFYFTLYTTMTGAYNVLGHVYKVISYLIIYRAVVVESIERPYLQLEQARKNMSLAVEASTTGMIMVDANGTITLTNTQTDTMFGYAEGALIGTSVEVLIPSAQRSQHGRFMQEYMRQPKERKMGEGRILHGRHRLGHSFRVEVGLTPIASENAHFVIASVVDITERVENEQRIEHLINYDHLTHLPNRHLLHARVSQAIAQARSTQSRFAMLFLDLDHFKHVNDTLGHSTGDQLLVEAGKRLESVLREGDTVARIGGDEFVLVMPHTDTRQAADMAEALLVALSQPYAIGIHVLAGTTSIGIAMFPEDGVDFSVLYQHADAAMYKAKQDGRNGYRFYTEEIQSHTERMLVLEGAMRLAQEQDQFFLQYQPQLSTTTGQVLGVEALIRWRHPDLGLVSPAEFVPLAESNGQIIGIGTWVLRTAVRQLRAWMDAGLAPMVMAVNLSAVQFRHPNLPALVSEILEEAGVAPQYLELELTEGVTMGNPQSAIGIMHALYGRGVRMSIDDFGTGYSSLSYLKKFKIYKLKIDQSFVRDIASDADDRAIVAAIVHMAHSLGFAVIAEGVETPAQHSFLEEIGCDEVQGYLFSRPLPADSIAAFIQTRAKPQKAVT